jgi:hypothetical protein
MDSTASHRTISRVLYLVVILGILLYEIYAFYTKGESVLNRLGLFDYDFGYANLDYLPDLRLLLAVLLDRVFFFVLLATAMTLLLILPVAITYHFFWRWYSSMRHGARVRDESTCQSSLK